MVAQPMGHKESVVTQRDHQYGCAAHGPQRICGHPEGPPIWLRSPWATKNLWSPRGTTNMVVQPMGHKESVVAQRDHQYGCAAHGPQRICGRPEGPPIWLCSPWATKNLW